MSDEASKSSPSEEFSSVPNPPIRTLRVELMSGNGVIPLIPNSREPTPFETDFFKGVAMLMIRTKPIDMHFNNFFEGRKRMFEVQVQGKFKREPAGEIFVGAEAPQKLELGLLTRSISNAAMRLAASMAQDLHYHFGDSQTDPNHQLPHVVAPMFTTFDKIIVTPPGEPLPPIGKPYIEDIEYRKKRLKFKNLKEADVRLDHTYSFSVNTSNLDLLCWTLMGIPMVKPMDLRMFFADSPIQLIAYEMPHAAISKFPGAHPNRFLSYMFSMRLTPVDPDATPIVELPCVISSEDEEEENVCESERKDGDLLVPSSLAIPTAVARQNSSDSEEEEEKEEEDYEESESSRNLHIEGLQSPLVVGSRKSINVRGWLKKKFNRNRETAADETDEIVKESSDYVAPDYEMELQHDLNLCPACIEINDPRNTNKRRHVYVLPLPENAVIDPQVEQSVQSLFNVRSPRLRSYGEIEKALPLQPVPKMHKNKRFSTLELRRRQIVETVRFAQKSPGSSLHAKWQSLLSSVTEIDAHFLNCNVVERTVKDSPCWEGYVALAVSRRHFVEYHMTLSKDQVIMKKNADTKLRRPNFSLVIPITDIASVQILPTDQCPMSDFGFLQIETITKVYYLLVKNDLQLTDWMQGFITLLGNQCVVSRFRPDHRSVLPSTFSNSFSLDLNDLYLARPACYKLDKRRVHNYRRIHFRRTAKQQELSPLETVEKCLQSAFLLVALESKGNGGGEFDWVAFWDNISQLQVCDVYKLSESERMVFFLNLYHVMQIHASLVYGPPSAWNQWHAFFNHICYVVGCELLSMAEIEFCLLKAGMSRTALFSTVAMAPPPQTIFPGLALSQRDFRLLFAINNGSVSFPEFVPLFTTEKLDSQLDEVTRRVVDMWLELDSNKKTISIPKLPLADFAVHRTDMASSKSSSLTLDGIGALVSYCSKPKKIAALNLLSDFQHISFKNKPLQFKCRCLSSDSPVVEGADQGSVNK